MRVNPFQARAVGQLAELEATSALVAPPCRINSTRLVSKIDELAPSILGSSIELLQLVLAVPLVDWIYKIATGQTMTLWRRHCRPSRRIPRSVHRGLDNVCPARPSSVRLVWDVCGAPFGASRIISSTDIVPILSPSGLPYYRPALILIITKLGTSACSLARNSHLVASSCPPLLLLPLSTFPLDARLLVSLSVCVCMCVS